MTAPATLAAPADEPFNWRQSDTGTPHAPFCPIPFLCGGVCREVTEFDGATVVFTQSAGATEPLVEIATDGRPLPASVAAQIALLVLARTHRTT